MKKIRILNRIICWEDWGIKYEPDPRHAEILIREFEIEDEEVVVTPGVKFKPEDIENATSLDDTRTSQ